MELEPAPRQAPRRRGGAAPEQPLNPPQARYTDACLPETGEVTHIYTGAGRAPGNLWFRWIHGSEVAAHNRDPRIQVMQYNEDTFVLRQNICVDWRGPFTYLLFGNKGALLIDTGATADPHLYPLRPTVEALMAHWQGIRRKPPIPLTIVLTSAEDGDQNMGAAQFAGRPASHVSTQADAAATPVTDSAPSDNVSSIDLGGRLVDVLHTPGTHRDGFSFYDRYTGLLFTGDLLFPGRISIANERDYLQTLERLQRWKSSHDVKWLLGGHVDMQFLPGRAYGRFATFKPYERELPLGPEAIDEALAAAHEIAGKPLVVARRNFWLLHGVGPDERPESLSADFPAIAAPRPV